MDFKKRVIIVGAGFGGLKLAREMSKCPFEIYLIDRFNFHQFQPLMYQVATARLEPASISFPLRKVFQHSKNVRVRVAEVTHIDHIGHKIETSIGAFTYDYLVLAHGCTTNYFGNRQLEQFSFPMKSVPEALQLRNRILQTFEDAVVTPPEEMEFLLNFVIVGGGPTGVELAGALAEMKKNILPKDYPDKDFSQLKVYLLEGSPNVLNVMSEDSKTKAQKYLEDLGVIVKTNTIVESYDGRRVILKNGETIEAKNVIWAAGVTGNIISGIPKECFTRGNRLTTNRYCQVQGIHDVFAIGDIAFMPTPKYPNGHPQVASVAIAHAKFLAENFRRLANGKPLKEFEYHDKGSMATVGKRKAVVDLPWFNFQGRFAWFTWMFVHLMLLLSVRNRILVFITWAYSYFTNDSTLRVLLKPVQKPHNNPTQ